MKEIAKGVCDAIEFIGLDCDWKATQAVLVAIAAILVVLLVTWLGTRHRIFRKGLDALYLSGGIASAGFLLAMLGIIVAQMVARWTGQAFPGSTSYAGYCMAASSFLALAYALNTGSHIRVNLLLTALGRHRRWGEIWCFAVAAYLATYFARYAIKATQESVRWNDISQGQDATPLWIPQIAMCVGTVILAISVWDNFFRILLEGKSNIEAEAIPDAPAPAPRPATPVEG